MFHLILSVIILFAIGTCTMKDACTPDHTGLTYRWCGEVFDKVPADKKNANKN